MENFDLSRLTSLSFERLIRALSFELMGPSGTVYSSGPDGARDYTFEGKIRGYEPRDWSGYLVLQAKFREKLEGGASDIAWLQKQISSELKKYTDKKAGLKRPKYYILATNVSLSGSDGNGSNGRKREGGVTKIEKSLDIWKTKIGILDYDIWHEAKIIDLLIAAPEVRQSYAAWITSGDVLAAALKSISPKNYDFQNIITRGLKESLRRDQHARLRDAGSVIDSQIRVSQVFIDLPISRPDTKILDFGDFQRNFQIKDSFQGVVGKIVERSKEKLDPESLHFHSNHADSHITKNRIVVLGGPGQGKSTASMFVAQLFRASLLSEEKSSVYDDNVNSLIPEILGRAKDEKISQYIPRRYPVFVSLPRFADAISKAKLLELSPPSLLGQIAAELSVAADNKLDRDDLRIWLKSYPWIAIFDGLDEVPPSGERKSVIEAIASFHTEVTSLNSDVLIIVTTRPQGYNNDLDSKQWDHWQLDDLPPERATAYAHALGGARYPADPYRREEILSSIKDATTKTTTARLLISPLQVTIMYLIVDTGGSVPAARWSLFNEYFEVLKKREKAKGGINQKILERNASQLGPIHQRAGLILQTDSEYAGGAMSSLDDIRFSKMLQEYLSTSEYEKDEIKYRANELMRVALDRLVLLSSREEGKIAFDVRSLQEFMAAAALTSGNQSDVENRLNHIANLSHWRHVFLIAASRCFAEDSLHHLRSTIVGIPRYIDSIDSDFNVRSGANLSLEMFIDGIGTDHPKSRRVLAQHALELLNLGPKSLDDRLASIIDEHTTDLITKTIKEKINETSSQSYLAAWKLLLILCIRSPEKFIPLAEEYWPKDNIEILNIIEIANDPLPTNNLVQLTFYAIIKSKPSLVMEKCTQYFEKLQKDSLPLTIDHSILMKFNLKPDADDEKNYIGLLSDGPLRVRFNTYDYPNLQELILPAGTNAQWIPLTSSANFAKFPTLENFSKTLVDISKAQALSEAKKVIAYLPWPLAAVIEIAENEIHLLALASSVKDGNFGNIEIWKSAQQRWKEFNISKKDLECDKSNPQFFKEISKIGMPFISGYQISHGQQGASDIAKSLEEIALKMQNGKMRFKIIEFAQFCKLGIESETPLTSDRVKNVLKIIKDGDIKLNLNSLFIHDDDIWQDDEAINLIADCSQRIQVYGGKKFRPNIDLIVAALNRNPQCREILIVITACILFSNSEFEIGLSKLNKEILVRMESDSLALKICSTLLNILIKKSIFSESEAKILILADDPLSRLISIDFVCNFLENEKIETECSIKYFDALLFHLEDKAGKAAIRIRESLKKKLNSRRSTLTSKNTWIDELNLPPDAFNVLQPINKSKKMLEIKSIIFPK